MVIFKVWLSAQSELAVSATPWFNVARVVRNDEPKLRQYGSRGLILYSHDCVYKNDAQGLRMKPVLSANCAVPIYAGVVFITRSHVEHYLEQQSNALTLVSHYPQRVFKVVNSL